MEGKKDFMDFLEENKEEIFRCVRRGATWDKELDSISIDVPNLDFQVRNWLVKNGIHDYVFGLKLLMDGRQYAVLRKKEENMDFLWYVVLFLAALFLSSVMYDLKTMSLLPSKENFLP